ncbi:hypothetical protein NKH18_47640 [Streptomyces sp. M10(2022)]
MREVAVMAEKVAGARRRLTEARKRLDGAIARAHERNRQLRHAATAARLPTHREELENVAQAVEDFAEAGRALSSCREQAEAAERDIAGRKEIIEEQTESCTEQAEALQARKDESAIQEERLRTQRQRSKPLCRRFSSRSRNPRNRSRKQRRRTTMRRRTRRNSETGF